jgi:REP element-mobilizing transposase RayT
VAETVHWIKGASSRWLNMKYKWKNGFAWQEGYGVFSVSLHDIKTIRNYIYNQEKHHKASSCVDSFEYVPKPSEVRP